ncbi:MAG: heme lyase CcmF/NrfE family subunit [Hyphomicrobiaceae bacterium]
MIIEAGHFAVILALLAAGLQVCLPLHARWSGNGHGYHAAASAAKAQLALLCLAFAALTWAYVASDFSVENVWNNSHSAKPLVYKISGVWGNHEGSMLLWVLILALFGALVAWFGGDLPVSLRGTVLSVQGAIGVAFLIFILATSNPFLRLNPAPVEGNGLNPILQDPALAFHPPMLYAGYVGFSMAFSFAVAALIDGRIDGAWARWVRPWTLIAWMFLTLGIAMGSWWAYYELGWGGWWFWDPVENASFMPWLVGTALLHSAIVMEKREALKIWTILLAILTFSLSLVGTFLVRSGVLTSVHAFAVDPARGIFILLILAVFVGGSLALYAWRAPLLKPGGIFAPISREGALVLNNLLLTVSALVVFVGTLYPLALDAVTGAKISVGPPYFNLTFVPLMIPLLVAVPIGPMLAWKRGDLRAALQRLTVAFGVAFVCTILALAFVTRGPWMAAFAIGLGVWLIAGALSEIAFRSKFGIEPAGVAWRRARGLPRSAYGSMLGHLGVGVMVLGITATSAWRTEEIAIMKSGETKDLGGYTIVFKGLGERRGPNYAEQTGRFDVLRGGVKVTGLEPSKRMYDAPKQGTTEAGIHATWRGDLYVVLGDLRNDGAATVRVYFNPLVRFIWIGALIMFAGGGLSLSDRRLRIGMPQRRRRRAGLAAEQEPAS